MSLSSLESASLTAGTDSWGGILKRLRDYVNGTTGGPSSKFSVAYNDNATNERGLCLTPDDNNESWQLNLYWDAATDNVLYGTIDPGNGFSSNADTLSPSSAQTSQGHTIVISRTGSTRKDTPWSTDFWITQADDCLILFTANDTKDKVPYVFMLGKGLITRFGNDGINRNFDGQMIAGGDPEFITSASGYRIFERGGNSNNYAFSSVRVAKEQWVGNRDNSYSIRPHTAFKDISRDSFGSGSDSWKTPTPVALEYYKERFHLGHTAYMGHTGIEQSALYRATDLGGDPDWVYIGRNNGHNSKNNVVIAWELGVSL